jgi:hypothetical protein
VAAATRSKKIPKKSTKPVVGTPSLDDIATEGMVEQSWARIQEAQAGILAIFPPDMLEDTLPTDMENIDVNPDICARIVEKCKNLNVGTALRTISDNLERINAASTAMQTLSEMQEFLGQNLDEATVKPLLRARLDLSGHINQAEKLLVLAAFGLSNDEADKAIVDLSTQIAKRVKLQLKDLNATAKIAERSAWTTRMAESGPIGGWRGLGAQEESAELVTSQIQSVAGSTRTHEPWHPSEDTMADQITAATNHRSRSYDGEAYLTAMDREVASGDTFVSPGRNIGDSARGPVRLSLLGTSKVPQLTQFNARAFEEFWDKFSFERNASNTSAVRPISSAIIAVLNDHIATIQGILHANPLDIEAQWFK